MPSRKKLIYYRDWNELPVLMNTAVCAAILNMEQAEVSRLCKKGNIPGGRKIGKRWYVNKTDLKNYFEKGSEVQQ